MQDDVRLKYRIGWSGFWHRLGKVSLLRPALEPNLFCRAEVLRAGKNLMFVEATVMVERGEGRIMVAKASSTLAVIAKKWADEMNAVD